MCKKDSTPARPADKPNKPNKPYPDFPLFPHAAGVWDKKILGKVHYFGAWADPDGALKRYLAEKDALHAGRKPREDADGYAVQMLCNDILNARRRLVESGELARRSWDNYKSACKHTLANSGKERLVADHDPDDCGGRRWRGGAW